MLVCEIVFLYNSELFHGSKVKCFVLSTFEYGCTFCCIQEFTLLVEEFERVPLAGVMGGGDDDTAVGPCESHCHFCGRSGGESGLDHIHTAGNECSTDYVLNHFSAETGILADNHLVAFPFSFWASFTQLAAIGVGEFYDVNRGEGITGCSSYGSANSGNGFYECHKYVFYSSLTFVVFLPFGRPILTKLAIYFINTKNTARIRQRNAAK